ncbi:MAG: Crp/Fnr family transcriptional regulator [Pseudolabrys sp.]|nr:Crp/Fnr family transcriptional regulator [Pseudolabrys sp.]
MPFQKNVILDQLVRIDPGLSQRRLRPISFHRGDVLGHAGDHIDEVYFPSSGMISLVVELDSGDRVEAGVAGYQGVIGASVAFGDAIHLQTGVVQLPGAGLAMAADELRQLAEGSSHTRALLHAQQQFILAQAQQSAACNAKHHIPARLATWMLRARDATGTTRFALTQEFVAEMLGVQRPSVSIVASQLQGAGLISYSRGHVQILDETGLEQSACECYRTIQRHQHNLLPAAPAVTERA